MYRRILVPLDGSKLAEQVLDFVKIVAPAVQAKVELFHVVDRSANSLMDPIDQISLGELTKELEDQGKQYLQKVAASFQADGIETSYQVSQGAVAGVIVDAAEETPDTLVAMTTHGRSGITRWLMGSVTDKVVQSATTPVLVYRAKHEPRKNGVQLKSILVPLDGSKLAEEVLPSATLLAHALELGVVLVMVTPASAHVVQGGIVPPEVDTFFEDIQKKSTEYLEVIQERLSQQGLASLSVHASMGRAARVIIETARGMEDNMVALTTHGRSGLSRWVLGSVADQVVRHSGDPVLVLRPSGQDVS